jgi:sterol desaturase/sphingolipid hydroxylase (fatty acid hydroxylase superfamily)
MSELPLSEPTIRLIAFAAIFATMAIFELVAPRLERDEMRGALKSKRWFTNIAMVVLSSLLMRLVFPLAAVGTAQWAAANDYGLFPALGFSPLVAGILAFIILDFAVWFEHVMSHRLSWLWRIHRMHHADTGFDLTTALRFHPLEIVLSMIWKAAIIIVLGAPVYQKNWIAICGWQSSRRICTACIIRWKSRKPIQTMDSISRFGTACLAHISSIRNQAMMRYRSA